LEVKEAMARAKAEDRLTDRQKRAILEQYTDGDEPTKSIAGRFGISTHTLSKLVREAGAKRFKMTVWLRTGRA
jgi:transposase-like protein